MRRVGLVTSSSSQDTQLVSCTVLMAVGRGVFLDEGLYPATMVWKMSPSRHNPGRLFAGMWGGGFLQLDVQEPRNGLVCRWSYVRGNCAPHSVEQCAL